MGVGDRYVLFGVGRGRRGFELEASLFAWEEELVRSVGLCLTMLLYKLTVVISGHGN